MHKIAPADTSGWTHDAPKAQLLGSGVGVPWALEAQQLLADDWGVAADVWSVTSWNELRRDGLAVARCHGGVPSAGDLGPRGFGNSGPSDWSTVAALIGALHHGANLLQHLAKFR